MERAIVSVLAQRKHAQVRHEVVTETQHGQGHVLLDGQWKLRGQAPNVHRRELCGLELRVVELRALAQEVHLARARQRFVLQADEDEVGVQTVDAHGLPLRLRDTFQVQHELVLAFAGARRLTDVGVRESCDERGLQLPHVRRVRRNEVAVKCRFLLDLHATIPLLHDFCVRN